MSKQIDPITAAAASGAPQTQDVAPVAPAAPEPELEYDGPVVDTGEEVAAPAAEPVVAAPDTPATPAAAPEPTPPTEVPATPVTPATGTAATVETPATPVATTTATPTTPPAVPDYTPSADLLKLRKDYEDGVKALRVKIADGSYSVVDDAAEKARLELLRDEISDRREDEERAYSQAEAQRQKAELDWQRFERENPHTTRAAATKLFNDELAKLTAMYQGQYTPDAIHLAARQRWEFLIEQGKKAAPPPSSPPAAPKTAPKAGPIPPASFMPSSPGRPRAVPSDPLDEFAAKMSNDAISEAFNT